MRHFILSLVCLSLVPPYEIESVFVYRFTSIYGNIVPEMCTAMAVRRSRGGHALGEHKVNKQMCTAVSCNLTGTGFCGDFDFEGVNMIFRDEETI